MVSLMPPKYVAAPSCKDCHFSEASLFSCSHFSDAPWAISEAFEVTASFAPSIFSEMVDFTPSHFSEAPSLISCHLLEQSDLKPSHFSEACVVKSWIPPVTPDQIPPKKSAAPPKKSHTPCQASFTPPQKPSQACLPSSVVVTHVTIAPTIVAISPTTARIGLAARTPLKALKTSADFLILLAKAGKPLTTLPTPVATAPNAIPPSMSFAASCFCSGVKFLTHVPKPFTAVAASSTTGANSSPMSAPASVISLIAPFILSDAVVVSSLSPCTNPAASSMEPPRLLMLIRPDSAASMNDVAALLPNRSNAVAVASDCLAGS